MTPWVGEAGDALKRLVQGAIAGALIAILSALRGADGRLLGKASPLNPKGLMGAIGGEHNAHASVWKKTQAPINALHQKSNPEIDDCRFDQGARCITKSRKAF
jgi:hypothetical protein